MFAGVGGFRCGLNNIRTAEDYGKEEKWDTVWFSQWEPAEKSTQYAHDCYVYRFGTRLDKNGEDTTNYNIEDVDKTDAKSDKSGDNENLKILSTLKKGEEISVINFETKTSETSPPTRYNSGSIILAMENAGKLIEDEELREQIKGAGIGTSATRAEIMKKLERIGYIVINTKTQIITPTKKGEAIYDVVYGSMPDMLNPKLTASWEKGLDMVAKKEIKSDEFMKKLEAYINSKVNKLVVKW